MNDPNKRVLIKVKGLLAEILLEIAPEVYSDYVHIDLGVGNLRFQLPKALEVEGADSLLG